MKVLLILLIVAAVAVVLNRWRIATRGQRLAEPPGPRPTPARGWFPIRPRDQVRRAKAAREIQVEQPQVLPDQQPKPPDAPF